MRDMPTLSSIADCGGTRRTSSPPPNTSLWRTSKCPRLIAGDKISLNGITRTTNELATELLKSLKLETPLPAGVSTKLIAPVGSAIE